MPNHCTSVLHLDGDIKHRQEFADKNKGFDWSDTKKEKEYKDLSFHAQCPIPKKHINSHLKNSSNSDWYGWCNSNWGTKWDAYELTLNHEDSYTTYCFDTAWSPPFEWINKVSKKFPNIRFNLEWAEEGGEGGTCSVQNGEMFEEHSYSQKEWRNFMGYEEEDYEDDDE
jgi:hypothetical protein